MTEDRSESKLAKERTEWAEDRTILANERTFAGWMRTGLAAVGIGLGFQAIFKEVEPTWLAKLAATIFICIGILTFYAAWRSGTTVLSRLDSHAAQPLPRRRLGIISFLFSSGSLVLVIVIWLLL